MTIEKTGWLRRAWRALWRPSARFSVATLMVGGLLTGVTFWGAFETAIEQSNKLEFCISCHEMDHFVYAEYAQTSHFKNASGVRATCADCHVPHGTIPKLATKIRATLNELPRHLIGTIDTEEKFEARRPHLAEKVWGRMRRDDSRVCRNCHEWTAMDFKAQPLRASREHEAGRDEGKTCIDCHQGVVHELPASMREPEDDDFDLGF